MYCTVGRLPYDYKFMAYSFTIQECHRHRGNYRRHQYSRIHSLSPVSDPLRTHYVTLFRYWIVSGIVTFFHSSNGLPICHKIHHPTLKKKNPSCYSPEIFGLIGILKRFTGCMVIKTRIPEYRHPRQASPASLLVSLILLPLVPHGSGGSSFWHRGQSDTITD
jgi:hypothetical protein